MTNGKSKNKEKKQEEETTEFFDQPGIRMK
jgi:hypothetical protein